jgi:hypothetical protein
MSGDRVSPPTAALGRVRPARRLALGGTVAACLAVATAIVAAGCGDDESDGSSVRELLSLGRTESGGSLELQDAEEFDAYTLYYLGDSFRGEPLTAVIRGSGRGPRRNWTFIYGTCEPNPGDEQGCSPQPLEVQNWSTCARGPDIHGERPELTSFRGARIARPPRSGSTEIYTGRTTVVIFGRGRTEALHALRPVGSRAIGKPLPPPAEGSLGSKLPCRDRGR